MTPDEPQFEVIEGLDIGEVNDNDEVLGILFKCGKCDRIFDSALPEAAKSVFWSLSQEKCRNLDCQAYSGFDYREENKLGIPDAAREFADLLRNNPKHPTAESRSRIGDMLKERNLKLLFEVSRPVQK